MTELNEIEIKKLIDFKVIITNLVNQIPNDMELGEKIRRVLNKEE